MQEGHHSIYRFSGIQLPGILFWSVSGSSQHACVPETPLSSQQQFYTLKEMLLCVRCTVLTDTIENCWFSNSQFYFKCCFGFPRPTMMISSVGLVNVVEVKRTQRLMSGKGKSDFPVSYELSHPGIILHFNSCGALHTWPPVPVLYSPNLSWSELCLIFELAFTIERFITYISLTKAQITLLVIIIMIKWTFKLHVMCSEVKVLKCGFIHHLTTCVYNFSKIVVCMGQSFHTGVHIFFC